MVPFGGGKMLTGEYQQIVLIDFDTRPQKAVGDCYHHELGVADEAGRVLNGCTIDLTVVVFPNLTHESVALTCISH